MQKLGHDLRTTTDQQACSERSRSLLVEAVLKVAREACCSVINPTAQSPKMNSSRHFLLLPSWPTWHMRIQPSDRELS